MFDLSGRKALVTGASGGIGEEIARLLHARGAIVGLHGTRVEKLEALAKDLGERVHIFPANLSDRAEVKALAEKAEAELGGVDILVNNSGGPTPGATEDMSEEVLLANFQAMVLRLITLTNRLLPGMKERGWGRILTVASSGVIEPIPGLALSNTLRPALAGWSKTLASEVADKGVTSNLLLPGSIFTDRLKSLDAAAAERRGESVETVRAESEKAIPARRYGTVEEFAATAAFLCSQPASYVTGSLIRCDGGAARSV